MRIQETPLKRGELARRCGVNIETVRYYEQRGLLPEPERNASNYRVYGEDAVRRLTFIGRAQDLGFTLKEIGELLALKADPGAGCADVVERADAKIADIDEKIRRLQAMRRALSDLRSRCSGETSECPILEALDHKESR